MSRERDTLREFEILSAIGDGQAPTQRALALRLGVALGLTNLYVRRLVRKGYVKVSNLDRKRLSYLLTPRGAAEKTRLTYEHMTHWAALYARTRRTLREGLTALVTREHRRVALYGTGEAAELAYVTLRELGLEPVGVFAARGGGTFLGYAVQDVSALAGLAVDAVVVATGFDRPDVVLAELEAAGCHRALLVPLRPPSTPRRARTVHAAH